MSLGPLILPFRADQYSFGLNFKDNSEDSQFPNPNFELSCIAFDTNGDFKDVVFSRKLTALDSAIVKPSPLFPPPDNTVEVEADDILYMYPKKFEREIEVMYFVASAPRVVGRANDLSFSNKLEFFVSYEDEGTPFSHTVDLKPLTGNLSRFPIPQSEWAGTVVVAVAYLTEQGWTLRSVNSRYSDDSLDNLVPALKQSILALRDEQGVKLDAADHLTINEDERITLTRQWQDQELSEAAKLPSSTEPVPVARLRLDLSWTFWPPPKPVEEDEEPLEDPTVEWQLQFFNKDGEEVFNIGTDSREGTGCTAGRPEPEEEEGEAAEEEPEKEENEDEENGEEGGEGEEKEAPPAPPAPKPDPYQFIERDVAYINMSELPPDVRGCVLVVGQYDAERGFEPIRAVRVKIMNITAGEEQAVCIGDFAVQSRYGMDKAITQAILLKMYKEYDDTAFALVRDAHTLVPPEKPAGSEGDEATLAEGVPTEAGADTGADGSAAAGSEGTDAAVTAALAAPPPLSIPSLAAFLQQPPELLVKQLCVHMKRRQDFVKEEAKAIEKAEEEGEEITKDMRAHQWRIRFLGVAMGGESATDEAVELEFRNAREYNGWWEAKGARTGCDVARVQFLGPPTREEGPDINQDSYFGGYMEDLKSGAGVYCFGNGVRYAGFFEAGKRHGQGVMVFPDGGSYVGAFAKDRFEGEGQYRYPDGSCYNGNWANGAKHGPGVYWDTSRGCLQGSWVKGVLKGEAQYDQPAYRFKGQFAQGVPAGPGSYTVCAHRVLSMPRLAAAHIQQKQGPTLSFECRYDIPPGSGDDPQLDEEGNPIEDPEKPPLPAFPKYTGLTFSPESLPQTTEDQAFPPTEALVPAPAVGLALTGERVVPLEDIPTFSVATGVIVPVPKASAPKAAAAAAPAPAAKA